MACTCCTGKLLKFTRNKQEANTMLNVFMNVMCRFDNGFISLYHSIQGRDEKLISFVTRP